MNPVETIKRAEHARQLLEDALLTEALNLIEADIIHEWENCPARDHEGKEELWKLMKTAKKFRGILQGAIESGKVVTMRAKSLKEHALSVMR